MYSPFREHPETVGDMISLKGFQVQIITECTALYSIILFGAVIFSAPASLKSRMAGLLAGIPFLVAANTLRIALVTMIGAKYPALFEPVHVYLAQVVMIILVVGVSLVWLEWSYSRREWSRAFHPARRCPGERDLYSMARYEQGLCQVP